MELAGYHNIEKLQQQHRPWLSKELALNDTARDPAWTERLTVGSEPFVDEVQALLGNKAGSRANTIIGEKYVLREIPMPYTDNTGTENGGLSSDN